MFVLKLVEKMKVQTSTTQKRQHQHTGGENEGSNIHHTKKRTPTCW
jgi:hypothetical protein